MQTRLRAWRERSGRTQNQAAETAGISLQYWRLIERHGYRPSTAIAARFEAMFGEPLEELLKPIEFVNLPAERAGAA